MCFEDLAPVQKWVGAFFHFVLNTCRTMKKCIKPECSYSQFGGGFCKIHQYCRPAKKTNSKNIFNKRKPTGELELFLSIYEEVEKICEICGCSIVGFSHSNFHHIKAKGKYPELRLERSNIQFICFDCHYKIHNK